MISPRLRPRELRKILRWIEGAKRTVGRRRRVPRNTAEDAEKCDSELCRNCVRSPRNRRQISSLTGSHRDAVCAGNSLNRLHEEMFRCFLMQLAGMVFQACTVASGRTSCRSTPFTNFRKRSPLFGSRATRSCASASGRRERGGSDETSRDANTVSGAVSSASFVRKCTAWPPASQRQLFSRMFNVELSQTA